MALEYKRSCHNLELLGGGVHAIRATVQYRKDARLAKQLASQRADQQRLFSTARHRPASTHLEHVRRSVGCAASRCHCMATRSLRRLRQRVALP